MSSRKPLILILLKIPVDIFLFISQFSGTLLYIPTYLYFLAIKPFVFSQKFENSSNFYAIFFIPRAILVAIGFIFAIAQMLFSYNVIMDLTHQEGKIMQYLTLFSTIFCLSFLFRRGYKQLFEKWKFPQLKSVLEHLEILLFFLRDMLSCILTLVVILLVVRIRNLIKYHQKGENKNQYLIFIWKMTYYSLFEDIGLLGYIFLHIFRWRLGLTKDLMKQSKYKIQELYIVYDQVFHTLIEIVFSPLLLIMIIFSKFTRRSVLMMIKAYPIEMVKRIVFDHFIEFVQETIRFLLLSLGCLILPYKIKLIPQVLRIYDEIYIRIKKQLDGNEYKIRSIENYIKLHSETNSNLKESIISFQNFFIISHLVDVIAIICFVLQAVTIFYLKRLNSVLKDKKLTYNYIQVLAKDFDKDIASIRESGKLKYLNLSFQMQANVIFGFLKMLFDVPFYLIGLISITLAPWRILDFRQKEYKQMQYMDRRLFALKSLFNSIIDWIAVILFAIAFVLTFLFRWSYIRKTVTAILRNDSENAIVIDSDSEQHNNEFLLNNLQTFAFLYSVSAVFDVLYSPLFLITFAPIYTIKIYKQLYNSLRIQDYEMTKSRQIILTVLGYLILDLFFAIFWVIINATFYKRRYYYSQLDKLVELKTQEYQNYQNTHKNHSTNSQESKKGEKKTQEKDYQKIAEIDMKYAIRLQKLSFLLLIVYFIFLDAISLIFRVVILLTYIKEKKYHLILSKKLEELQSQKNIEHNLLVTDYEHFKFKLKFKISIKLIIQILVAILCIAFSVVSTWRIPFLVMIIRSKVFIKQITGKEKLKTPIHFSLVYGATFIAYILDLVYLPLLLVSTLTNPFVVINYVRNVTYRYSQTTSESLFNQVYTHKRIIFHYVFVSALKDITMTFKLLCILLTGIRIPFLVLMARKNQLDLKSILIEFYSMVKPQSNKVSFLEQPRTKKSKVGNAIKKISKKVQEENTENKEENSQNKVEQSDVDGLTQFVYKTQYQSKKLTFRTCVNVSFVEMLQDIPLVLFSIIITIIFPWRLFSIIRLWKLTLLRIPQIEDEFGKVKLNAVRRDLLKLFGNVFIYDLPCIILNCILILSIYKIPKIIQLFRYQLRKTFRNQEQYDHDILENFDYRRELKKQVKHVWQDIQTWVQYLIIHLLFIRIKSLKRRLRRFDHKKITQEKLKLYSMLNPIPLEDRPTRACMQTLSFNVYSRIADFLDVKDLGSMLLTNRKLHYFTKQEIIWQHLFENKYTKMNIHFYQEQFQQKCIEGYIYEQKQQIGQPISEEVRDDIIGRKHIIFDEYLLSIFEFPSYLADGFSGQFSKIFEAVPQSQDQYNIIKLNYRRLYYINYLSLSNGRLINDMVSFQAHNQEILNKERSVFLAQRLIYNLVNIFESYIYYLSLVPQFILKILNAGEAKNYHLVHETRENFILPQEVQPYSLTKIFIYSFFQTFGLIILVLYFQTLFLGCFEYSYFYRDATFLESLFWPNPLILLIQFITNCFLLNQYFVFQIQVFAFFKPQLFYKIVIRKIFALTKYIFRKIVESARRVTKPLYDALVELIHIFLKFTSVFKFVPRLIKFVISKIIDIVNTIRSMMRFSKSGYYMLLTNAYFFFRKFNLLGDLIFTIFVFIWMFWPLFIAFYFRLTSLWISAVLVSIVLMVKGYLLIKKVSNQ